MYCTIPLAIAEAMNLPLSPALGPWPETQDTAVTGKLPPIMTRIQSPRLIIIMIMMIMMTMNMKMKMIKMLIMMMMMMKMKGLGFRALC